MFSQRPFRVETLLEFHTQAERSSHTQSHTYTHTLSILLSNRTPLTASTHSSSSRGSQIVHTLSPLRSRSYTQLPTQARAYIAKRGHYTQYREYIHRALRIHSLRVKTLSEIEYSVHKSTKSSSSPATKRSHTRGQLHSKRIRNAFKTRLSTQQIQSNRLNFRHLYPSLTTLANAL